MNALIIPFLGMAAGALAAASGVLIEVLRRPRKSKTARVGRPDEQPQVLVTVSNETPEQLSEVVIYTSSGKAEHYALKEPPNLVAMRVEEAAQRALDVGEPTRIETAEAPRLAVAD